MTRPWDKYRDIIEMKRPESERKRMSAIDRAAQFSPFAALTGYDDLVNEAARLTDARIELSPEAQDELAVKFNFLLENKNERADFTVFVQDKLKAGGTYVTYSGCIIAFDEMSQVVTLDCGVKFNTDDVVFIGEIS